MTVISKGQRAPLYKYKRQKKMRNVFIYKKPDTLQKSRQFPLHFSIQKSGHFALRDFSLNLKDKTKLHKKLNASYELIFQISGKRGAF